MYEAAGIRLFARNVRGFLGKSTQVNRGMQETLSEEPWNFWYYNNGITMMCDHAERKSVGGRDVMRVSNPQISFSALAGPSAFFVISNFGVWLAGHLYPATWEGLAACYVAALPFYRNSLVSTVVYTTLLFGANEIYQRKHVGIETTANAS